MKKIPMRMCVITKEKLPKKDLIRIVMNENEIKIDLSGKLNGKGCYLKKDIEVINKAKNTKVLNRVFETDVNVLIYDELLKMID
ncbi:MAG: YlxR family protein [Bacilli bacterium]|nr:YlxR family protein [Bacilli bacterium]